MLHLVLTEALSGVQLRYFTRAIAASALSLFLYACAGSSGRNPDVTVLPILNEDQKAVLGNWLAKHPDLRIARDTDCDCAEDISETRRSGPSGQPIPNYEPYVLAGDFHGDGKQDFAVILAKTAQIDNETVGVLVIFDGPFDDADRPAAFVKYVGAIAHMGLFPSADAGHLLVGPFFSEGCEYLPKGNVYKEDCSEN